MRTTRILTALVTLILGAQALLAQTVSDWRFAHPQATLVGGVRLGALMESPVLKMALEQATAKEPQAAMVMPMMQSMFKGVTDIRFSFQDIDSKNPDVLVMVSGTLDPATLNMLAGKMESQAIGTNTLLIGQGASLKAAVDRLTNASPAEVQSNAFLFAGQITGTHDIWLAGQIPNIPALPLPGMSLNLQGFALGVSLGESLSLEAAIQTASPEQAEALVKLVRTAEAQQPAGIPPAEISVQGNMARMKASVPAAQIREAMQNPALTGLMGTAGAQGLPELPPPPPPKPAKPKRNTVIIQGLESGTLEIPIDGPAGTPARGQ